MADLGTLTTREPERYIIRNVPIWDQRPGTVWLSKDVSGILSGTVQEESPPESSTYVAKAGVLVGLLWRPTLRLIATTVSAVDGAYSFSGLDTTATGLYVAVALDDAATPVWNVATADLLTPV